MGLGVNAPVAGFQICGSPALPHESTCPFGRRCRWTATTGQANGAPHAPTWALAAAGAAARWVATGGGHGIWPFSSEATRSLFT